MRFSHYERTIFLNSSSLMIFTPSDLAFSNFEPGSSPSRRKLVFLLTLSVTLPPYSSMNSLACSREKLGRVPVTTNVIPVKAPCSFFAFSTALGHTPAFLSFAKTFWFAGRWNQSTIASAMFGPTPSICIKSSALTLDSESRLPK